MAKKSSSGNARNKRKKLTPAEKRALVKGATKAAKFLDTTAHRGGGQKGLLPEKRDQIFALAEALKQRPKPVVGMEAIALWSAKIDWAIVNGDRPKVVKLLKTPLGPEMIPKRQTQLWDSNGNCRCGGGGGGA